MSLRDAMRAAGVVAADFKPEPPKAPRVHRVSQCFTKVRPIDPACTIKTRVRQKTLAYIREHGAVDFWDSNGANRFQTPVPAHRKV